MKITSRISVLILGIVCWVGGCRNEIPSEYRSFLALPYDRQSVELAKYSLREQVDLYLLASTYGHPSNLDLASDIASRGAPIVPFLTAKLTEDTNDVLKLRIFIVFYYMAQLHSWGPRHDSYIEYDVVSAPNVMELLEETVSNMEEGNREEAKYWLERIQKQ